jgi:hypothetical protein
MTTPDSTCAYCGVTEIPLTRDHVVPRAFWKDTEMPSNPVTVPACEPCQKHWDAETTYFRNMLVVQSAPESHPAITRLASGPVKRRVEKSRPDLLDISRNAVPAWKQSKSGLYVERGVNIDIDIPRFQRTPEKIIRGLFYFRNAVPVPSDYDVCIFPGNDFWDDEGFKNVLETMEDWQGLGDDVFQMRATRDVNDPNVTAWLLAFFRSFAFFGYTCPKTY